MIRRTFLKKGLLTVAGGALGGSIVGSIAQPLLARGAALDLKTHLSVSILTDRPDEAIEMLQDWFELRAAGLVRVTSHPLAGRHVGDIALFMDGQLIDYRLDSDRTSPNRCGTTGDETNRGLSGLRCLANAYDLPRSIDDPTMVRFEMGSANSMPSRADVYSDGRLIQSLPLAQDANDVAIENEFGHMRVSVRDGRLQVLDASCKHKTCLKMSAIGSAGQSLACIPGRIAITLDGRAATDAITM